jgi:hypothetical protein
MRVVLRLVMRLGYLHGIHEQVRGLFESRFADLACNWLIGRRHGVLANLRSHALCGKYCDGFCERHWVER